MTRFQQIAFAVLAFLFSVGMIVSGTMIWLQQSSRQQDIDDFNDLQQLVVQTTVPPIEDDPPVTETPDTVPDETPDAPVSPDASDGPQIPDENTDTPPQTEQDPPADVPAEPTDEKADTTVKRNLPLLIERNSDCIGWICIEDTVVNYPVMHTPDAPEKYLRRNFDGKYSYSGVPFMDWRCTLDGDNRIIYGHNMKNDTMFSDVVDYAEESYWKAHPVIEFETEAGCETYAVFAVVRTDASDQWYLFIDVEDAETYDREVSYIKSKSLYDTGITPQYGQRLITLSTCEYSDDDARLLVIAVEE